jgi:hypothetical protein
MPVPPGRIWTRKRSKASKASLERHVRNVYRFCENQRRAEPNRRSRFFALSSRLPVCFFLFCDPVVTLTHVVASVSRYTISHAVPHLVRLFLSPDELSNRAPIIILLAELVVAARDSMLQSAIDQELDVPLIPYKDEVLGVFTVGLKTTHPCQPAIAGLKAVVTTPGLLADDELGFVVHNVHDILLADSDNGDDAMLVIFSCQ